MYTVIHPTRNILRLLEVQKTTRVWTTNCYQNIRFKPLATRDPMDVVLNLSCICHIRYTLTEILVINVLMHKVWTVLECHTCYLKPYIYDFLHYYIHYSGVRPPLSLPFPGDLPLIFLWKIASRARNYINLGIYTCCMTGSYMIWNHIDTCKQYFGYMYLQPNIIIHKHWASTCDFHTEDYVKLNPANTEVWILYRISWKPW